MLPQLSYDRERRPTDCQPHDEIKRASGNDVGEWGENDPNGAYASDADFLVEANERADRTRVPAWANRATTQTP